MAALDLDRRRPRAVQHLGGVDHDLDLAGRHVRVRGAFRTAAYLAAEQHDPLGADRLGDLERLAGVLGVERALDDPVRSRTSMKTSPPWSRRLPTQPARVTSLADRVGGKRTGCVRAHRIAGVEHR